MRKENVGSSAACKINLPGTRAHSASAFHLQAVVRGSTLPSVVLRGYYQLVHIVFTVVRDSIIRLSRLFGIEGNLTVATVFRPQST